MEALFITQTLHQALIRLQKPAEDRLVWIDALAINKSDIVERNVQACKMLIIHKGARAVLAWIGRDDEDLGGPTMAWGSVGLAQQGFKIPDWDCIFNEVHNRDYVQLLYSLKWLDQYEYWSRAWIIQELMAQQYHLYDVEAGENPADCALAIGSRLSATMLTSIRKVGQDGMLDLGSWLKLFILMHQPRCLDPRDMIYAFYSLFPSEIQGKISIDYAMPTADLFTLMTSVYIETTSNIWLLSFVEIPSRYCSATPTPDTGVPTWAFNFAGKIPAFSQWHKPICDEGIEDGKASIFYHRFEMGVRSLLHVRGVCIRQVQQFDRSIRHKLFLPTSFELSKFALGVASSEKDTFLLAFLGPFAEPEDLSSLLPQNLDSLNALERKYWQKPGAALRTHFERLVFSYIPKHSRGQSDETESRRHFALGNPGVLTGDKLCLILGCPLPILLRQAGNYYSVVGSAYAHGYMEGKAMDALSIAMDDLEDFCLC